MNINQRLIGNTLIQLSKSDDSLSSDKKLDDFKDILSMLEIINKKEVFIGSTLENVKFILKYKTQDLFINKINALNLLKILKEHKSSASMEYMEIFYNSFISFLEDNFDHFGDLKGKLPAELTVFSPFSCAEIIKAKLTSKGIPFEVSSGEKDVLKGLIENLSTDSTQKEIACLVKASSLSSDFGDRPHVMPLILRRTSDEIEIICTDSLGNHPKGWLEDLARFIKAECSTKQRVPINLYRLSTVRQRDEETCATFAIDDICHYFTLKHKGFDLFAFVKKQAKQADYNEPLGNGDQVTTVYDFKLLPPYMMKLTQSIEQIKTYLEENPALSKEIVKDKNQESLMENLNRYIFKTRDYRRDWQEISINCHARIKAARYGALLFENMIKLWIKE